MLSKALELSDRHAFCDPRGMRILASFLLTGLISITTLPGCCSGASGDCATCADDTRRGSQAVDSECAVVDGGGDGAAGSSGSSSGGASGSSGAGGSAGSSGGAGGSAGTAGTGGK